MKTHPMNVYTNIQVIRHVASCGIMNRKTHILSNITVKTTKSQKFFNRSYIPVTYNEWAEIAQSV